MKSEQSILFIVNSLRLSGAGKMVHYVAELCTEHFNRVYAASLSKEEMVKKNNGVIYTYVPQKYSSGGYLTRIKTIRNIRHFIKDINPNICVAFVSDVAFSTRVATLFNKEVIFVSAERGDPFTLPRLWKMLVSWAYRRSDYCIFQLNNARDFFGKSILHKSFVIPNIFIPEKSLIPFSGCRRKTIVSAGRFVYEKGFDILIAAFKRVHDKYPDYILKIYGEGPLKEDLNRIVDSYGLHNFVSFPGFINNVAATVREDGMFILPSRYEGIPNVLIEVLAIGVPTISANCTPGGPAYLTNNGARGLLFPVGDDIQLALCIEKLIENQGLSNELSRKAPEVCDLLDENRIKSMWISAIRTISRNVK